MSSQGSTKPAEPEESEINQWRGGMGEDKRREPRAKSQHKNNEQDNEEYIVNQEGGRRRTSEDKGHSETNQEVAYLQPRMSHHYIHCVLEPGN
jgi:hypothetical protein